MAESSKQDKDPFDKIMDILDEYEQGCTMKRTVEEMDFSGNPDGCC